MIHVRLFRTESTLSLLIYSLIFQIQYYSRYIRKKVSPISIYLICVFIAMLLLSLAYRPSSSNHTHFWLMPVPTMMIKEPLFSVMIAYAICLLLLNMPIA